MSSALLNAPLPFEIADEARGVELNDVARSYALPNVPLPFEIVDERRGAELNDGVCLARF